MSLLDIVTVDCHKDLIDRLYESKSLPIKEIGLDPRPNGKFILKANSSSALAIADTTGYNLFLLGNHKPFKIEARSKEQSFLLELLHRDIPLVLVSGRPGTGKTMLAMAYALDACLDKDKYKNIILTKPTYMVGNGPGIGTFPGPLGEKYLPFLGSYLGIVSDLGLEDRYLELLETRGIVKYIPIQMMRGMNFHKSVIILDEGQSLSRHEMKTLCTRTGKDSKLIIMGDLHQSDRKLPKEDRGFETLLNSELIKNSPLCAGVELIRNERSPLSDLLERAL